MLLTRKSRGGLTPTRRSSCVWSCTPSGGGRRRDSAPRRGAGGAGVVRRRGRRRRARARGPGPDARGPGGRYLATATPIAFAAALPHCGPGALEAFTREYVARECLKTQTLERSDGARDDDGGISSGLFLESSSLAERAIRRAVSLCDDGDDAAGTVRDAITRVLAAVASFRGASEEEDEKTVSEKNAPADATGPASLATTLLGAGRRRAAASAKHMRVFSEHVFPALSRNAAARRASRRARRGAGVHRGRARGRRGGHRRFRTETGPLRSGRLRGSAEAARCVFAPARRAHRGGVRRGGARRRRSAAATRRDRLVFPKSGRDRPKRNETKLLGRRRVARRGDRDVRVRRRRRFRVAKKRRRDASAFGVSVFRRRAKSPRNGGRRRERARWRRCREF